MKGTSVKFEVKNYMYCSEQVWKDFSYWNADGVTVKERNTEFGTLSVDTLCIVTYRNAEQERTDTFPCIISHGLKPKKHGIKITADMVKDWSVNMVYVDFENTFTEQPEQVLHVSEQPEQDVESVIMEQEQA